MPYSLTQIINIMKMTKAKEMSGNDIVMEGRFWVDDNGKRYRYVDPMTDKGFKILFGSEGNENLLMGLLNRIIPDADIVDLRYCNNEHQGMSEDDSGAIFDVHCENSEGVRFLVEMQNWSQRYFNKRAVYYSTFGIQDQASSEKRHQLKTLGKDRWDYNYAPIYVVCLLTFNMKKNPAGMEKVKEDEYLSFYRYVDVESGEELGDGTTLVFVEMKKFRKSMRECKTGREKLLCALKNMSGQLEVPVTESDPLLKEIYAKAEIAAMPKNLRINYINYIMSRNDELNSRAEMLEDALAEGLAAGRAEGRAEGLKIGLEEGREEGRKEGREVGRKEGREVGREEGRKEGREVGREEGREEVRMETAVKLKKLGLCTDDIAMVTGLNAEIIERL